MDTRISSPKRREFLKGLAAGAGGYALGSLVIHPNEAMGKSVQGYLEKVPMEARWDRASNGLVRAQVFLYKTLYDKEGREKFVEDRKQTCPVAAAGNKKYADRFGLTGNDAKSAAAIIPAIVTLYYGPQQKYKIEEATAKKARVKCLDCAFWNVVQAQKITDDLCSAHCRYYWEGFANAINPKLTSTLLKARPLGDSVCEWVIEIKT
ncbi:MAG: hypothetical protein A2Z51_11580 [Deltaproteobacteria bacterium RBG_19FT_COMBO_52_11]|nr:MAG: hypothetical protein A2Z51_11580 [Deltaproteobacteria bacterium RBG_19FT_COMBO_52_11]